MMKTAAVTVGTPEAKGKVRTCARLVTPGKHTFRPTLTEAGWATSP